MTRLAFYLFGLAALAGALLLAAPPAKATAPFVFQIDLYGANEVPPVQTAAYGFLRFFFSDNRLEADVTVDVKGLSGSLVEGADIHRGLPGTNGPVVKHLVDGGFIVTSAKLRLTQAELQEMLSGVWYASVKTKSHPQGEMRGQIIVPEGFVASTPAATPPQAAATATPPAAAPPSGTGIRPPNTGDGGLAAPSGLPAGLVAAGLTAGALGVLALARGRRCV